MSLPLRNSEITQNPPFKSLEILGGRVDDVSSRQILSVIEAQINEGRFLQIITANALMLLHTEKDPELQTVFNSAGLVVPESSGVALLARLKRFSLQQRIPGIDLMNVLFETAEKKGWSVYLVGAKPGIAERAKLNLQKKFPKLNFCGIAHGYFNREEEQKIISDIKEKKPQLAFVGLKVPHQEKWIYNNFRSFEGLCMMGVGGSFDVLSGNLKRAPDWMQKLGLEWLFRFSQEPWRWRRMIRLPLFLYKGLLD